MKTFKEFVTEGSFPKKLKTKEDLVNALNSIKDIPEMSELKTWVGKVIEIIETKGIADKFFTRGIADKLRRVLHNNKSLKNPTMDSIVKFTWEHIDDI